jgi:hypothetical protein
MMNVDSGGRLYTICWLPNNKHDMVGLAKQDGVNNSDANQPNVWSTTNVASSRTECQLCCRQWSCAIQKNNRVVDIHPTIPSGRRILIRRDFSILRLSSLGVRMFDSTRVCSISACREGSPGASMSGKASTFS